MKTLISIRSAFLNYSIQIYSPQTLQYFGNLCVHQKPLNVDTVRFSAVIIWLHTSAIVTNLQVLGKEENRLIHINNALGS